MPADTGRRRGPSPLVRGYLVLYNVAQALGWAACLAKSIQSIAQHRGLAHVYLDAGKIVELFQGLSFLEVLHAITGIVPGSPATALTQWVGRSNVLFAILHCIPEIWVGDFPAIMILAWSLAEVMRYPFYAANSLGSCPRWLTWLRYTMFIPLYPIGVVGEMKVVYDGLPYIRARGLHSLRLPNAANWGFDYAMFMTGVLVLYPLLWLQLYTFMFGQRAKKLRAKED